VTADFAMNNKTYSATKVSIFMKNYSRELRIEVDIRRKNITMEFTKRMKKV